MSQIHIYYISVLTIPLCYNNGENYSGRFTRLIGAKAIRQPPGRVSRLMRLTPMTRDSLFTGTHRPDAPARSP